MGKRKVTILETAAEEVAHIAFYIEAQGLTQTAKKFVNDAFAFFDSLSDDRVVHRPCKHEEWKLKNYRCVNFRRKYIVAYIYTSKEVIICDFALQKLIKT